MPDAAREVARALRVAEDRLRAEGLTGGRAFDALLDTIRARLGDPVAPHPAAEAALGDLAPGPDVDLLGLAYERFFADLFKGGRGQYFTPRPLVALLLSRAGLAPGDRVLDPTCGSGGLLVEAARLGARVVGIDRDPLLARLAALNLRLGGHDADVRCADFFAARPEPFDAVIANPPFSVVIDEADVLARYQLAAGRDRALSDHLFLEAIERWVRPGGLAALVLPWSIVTNARAEPLRQRVDAGWVREAICALPEGVFRPFGGAAGRACLLWLRRRPVEEVDCAWAELSDPGYDVRSTRYKPTDAGALEALCRGEGWSPLPDGAWSPAPTTTRGRRVRDLATLRDDRVVPSRVLSGELGLVELADTDKTTGEVVALRRAPSGDIDQFKAVLGDGDVLVSRMRPELGNVAILHAPSDLPQVVGSTEWLPLAPVAHGHWLLHALRAPAWRDALPITEGQTRPRTTGDAVLDAPVAWPGEAVAARVHRLSERLHAERAALRARLDALQSLVDRFAAGEIDAAALDEAIAHLER